MCVCGPSHGSSSACFWHTFINIEECRWRPTSDHLFTALIHSIYFVDVICSLSLERRRKTRDQHQQQKWTENRKSEEAKMSATTTTTTHFIFNYVIHIFMLQFTWPSFLTRIAKPLNWCCCDDKSQPKIKRFTLLLLLCVPIVLSIYSLPFHNIANEINFIRIKWKGNETKVTRIEQMKAAVSNVDFLLYTFGAGYALRKHFSLTLTLTLLPSFISIKET